MVGRKLVSLYSNYSLILGITSYRYFDGEFQQSKLTRYYALAINIFTIIWLPNVLLDAVDFMKYLKTFPQLISITMTTNLYFIVMYMVVVYTILSRGTRDKILKHVHELGVKLRRMNIETNPLLLRIFYLKMFTVFFLHTANILAFGMWSKPRAWLPVLNAIFLINTMNILGVATYAYFLALWVVARGYDFVNGEFKGISTNFKDKKELHDLWHLRTTLDRTVQKINRMYGLLMLAARFDYFIFGVINSYWGYLLMSSEPVPHYMRAFGSVFYLIRAVDFFLLDYICDLTVKYQSEPKHALTERNLAPELSSFVIYETTSKPSISICGLFEVNRNQWYQTMCAILTYSIVLLQFHLYLMDKQHIKI